MKIDEYEEEGHGIDNETDHNPTMDSATIGNQNFFEKVKEFPENDGHDESEWNEVKVTSEDVGIGVNHTDERLVNEIPGMNKKEESVVRSTRSIFFCSKKL